MPPKPRQIKEMLMFKSLTKEKYHKQIDEIIQLYKDQKIRVDTAKNLILKYSGRGKAAEAADRKLKELSKKETMKGRLSKPYVPKEPKEKKAKEQKPKEIKPIFIYFISTVFTRKHSWKDKKTGEYTHPKISSDPWGKSISSTSESAAISIFEKNLIEEWEFQKDYEVQEVLDIGNILVHKKTSAPVQNILQQPMRAAQFVKYDFIPDDVNKYDTEQGTCAIDIFVGIYSPLIKSITRESFIELCSKEHRVLYALQEDYQIWTENDGVTPEIIKIICEKYDISVYAYDLMRKNFMKFVSKNSNYPALIFYAGNGHMYLVSNKEEAVSLVRSAVDIQQKMNTKIFHEKIEKEYQNNIIISGTDIKIIEIKMNVMKELNQDYKQEKEIIIIYDKSALNDELYQYYQDYQVMPDAKSMKTTNTAITSFSITKPFKAVLMADPNTDVFNCTHREVQSICAQTNQPFKNQSFPSLIKTMKNKHFSEKDKRKVSRELRTQIFEEERKCNICNKSMSRISEAEIDHIIPLASGGMDEKSNLQVLCKVCHRAKTSNERDHGYISASVTESTFNSKVQNLFNSHFAQTYAYVEYAIKNIPKSYKGKPIYKYDINKCRKNILYHSEFDYCLFTVMDDIKVFNSAVDTIKPGRYFLETKQYMPCRGNGWYYHNTVSFFLEQDLITLDDIKYVVYSSLTVPKNHYNGFIDEIYKTLPEDKAKLAINSMIGQFKLKDREFFKSLNITTDVNTDYQLFLSNKGTHIFTTEHNNTIFYEIYTSYTASDIETEGPIYQ